MPGFTKPKDERERLPREQIPEDLTCTLCDKPTTFKNVAGYQGHMAAMHAVHFDRAAVDSSDPEQARLAQWRKNDMVPRDPVELPVWAKVAIVKHEMFGETWATCAEQMGKSALTLSAYAKTPAGRKAVAEVRELGGDIKQLVKLI